MLQVLVGTDTGCRVFSEARELGQELAGRNVGPLAAGIDGSCIAVVDHQELWRRSHDRIWFQLAATNFGMQSILEMDGALLGGGLEEAAIVRVSNGNDIERLKGFEETPGHSEWRAGGPPLGVRSLAATCDGETLIAAVHVGGLPRSQDRGRTWTPTIPIMFDVHEVRAHPSRPGFVAAAAAVGLCVSHDGGKLWEVMANGLNITNSLAVAVLESEVLFSVQDGPFAKQSQLWRWPIGGEGELQQVRQGLPEWLEGKVDTAQITSGGDRAAICDGGGNLWLSDTQSSGWKCLGKGLGYASGLLIVSL
ncbi:MAG: hypothetical protein M3O30_16760 [Planctomycetota bacterium]|nr:hypothetical protein [Planctomycetota bacterium]